MPAPTQSLTLPGVSGQVQPAAWPPDLRPSLLLSLAGPQVDPASVELRPSGPLSLRSGPTSSPTRPMPTTTTSRCTPLTRPPTAKPAECSSGEEAAHRGPYVPAPKRACPPRPDPPHAWPALCWAQRGWGVSLQCQTILSGPSVFQIEPGGEGAVPVGAPGPPCRAAEQGWERSGRRASTGRHVRAWVSGPGLQGLGDPWGRWQGGPAGLS